MTESLYAESSHTHGATALVRGSTIVAPARGCSAVHVRGGAGPASVDLRNSVAFKRAPGVGTAGPTPASTGSDASTEEAYESSMTCFAAADPDGARKRRFC